MVVYADILICFNTIITYFILLAAKTFSGVSGKIWRLVAASIAGGCSSLYIFVPEQSAFAELTVKLLFSAMIVFTAFGTRPIKQLLRSLLCFYAVSFLYAGFMIAFWYVLKPKGMAINNGIVYFSVSPAVLILSTVVCYGLIKFFGNRFKREDAYCVRKDIKIMFNGNSVCCKCIVDTGCTISDPFGDHKVIIADKSIAEVIFGVAAVSSAKNFESLEATDSKFRIIPYKTLAGKGLLPCLRADTASVDNREIKKVLVGISDTNFDGDFKGIISPDFLL